MLLRRITQHVRNQNWFAVFIDFLIVVIGILIAFQITEWNEARAEKKRINEQLSSFHEELVLARDDLQNYKTYYEDRIASVTELRQKLSSKTDFSMMEFNQLAVSSLRGSPLLVAFRAYEEMATTGSISKVADESLRELLYQWDTVLTGIKTTDEILENVRATLIIPVAIESTAFGNVFQADERYKQLHTTDRFEIGVEDIRSNRQFDNVMALRQVQAEQQLNTLIDFIDKTEELITALKSAENQ